MPFGQLDNILPITLTARLVIGVENHAFAMHTVAAKLGLFEFRSRIS
jgi:hypothetical protein